MGIAIKYFTNHIAINRDKLNLEHLARYINVPYPFLIRSIDSLSGEKGEEKLLPRHCLPKLLAFFEELRP